MSNRFADMAAFAEQHIEAVVEKGSDEELPEQLFYVAALADLHQEAVTNNQSTDNFTHAQVVVQVAKYKASLKQSIVDAVVRPAQLKEDLKQKQLVVSREYRLEKHAANDARGFFARPTRTIDDLSLLERSTYDKRTENLLMMMMCMTRRTSFP